MNFIHRFANFALSSLVGLMLIAGPALAISAVKSNDEKKISGAGLVLMVSLQRM